MTSTARMTFAVPELALYYDFSCPYAYLASTQVDALCARAGATLRPRPILLGGLFRHWERPQEMQAGMSPPKARHNLDDMHRWACFRGVPFVLPAGHPRRTVEALRWVHASAPSDRWPLSRAIYRAYWVDGLDVGSREVLAGIAAEIDGGAATEALGAIDTPEVKQALWDETNGAIELGIFGVPTFVVDGALFWGQDRLHFVEAALTGRHPSEVHV